MDKNQKVQVPKDITKESVLIATLPAKRRLIFRWCEAIVLVCALLVVWLLMAQDLSGALIGVVCVFLALFAAAGIIISLLLRKNTVYVFTPSSLIVHSGVVQILKNRLAYSEIALCKKVVGLPDILTKRETATFKIYKIQTKKNGRRVLVQDRVCSMYGVKKHREISKLFEENDVPFQKSAAQKRALKKQLAAEWKIKKAKAEVKKQKQKQK